MHYVHICGRIQYKIRCSLVYGHFGIEGESWRELCVSGSCSERRLVV